MTPEMPSSKRTSIGLWQELGVQFAPNATVFLSSACIMVVELVAGRLITRYLGQSLYTWTTIIGVVLAGISIGNYIGGRWADRSHARATLAFQFLLASAACLSVLATNTWVGEWQAMEGLSWPARIVVHVTLVFFIPSMVLGTISPVIAKRALTRGLATGRTIGNVYAWATVGSILGTMLTGFCLVVFLGVKAIVALASGLLASIGVFYGVGALKERNQKGDAGAGSIERDGTAHESFARWWRPIFTVFMANACIMVVEIDAGRIMARQFGQSLYTWTTVIGVVLAGMSLGSYLGGKLADRFRLVSVIASLFLASSVSCISIPFLNAHLAGIRVFELFSWPMQILMHATGLFFIPSVLLGAVTPAVAKMALLEGHGEGKTVGTIYAWGSVGSIAGTFLAGFVLIATVGTLHVLSIAAFLLAAMGVLYEGRRIFFLGWAGACAVPIFFSVAPWPAFATLAERLSLKETNDPNVVYIDESQYSYIAVVADANNPSQRELYLDKLVHSQVDLDNPRDLKYEYEWVYSTVINGAFDQRNLPDKPLCSMVIGGGGYTFPYYLELTRPGSYIEVSEIDPAVTQAAHSAFGLPADSGIAIYNMDARNRVADLIQAKRAGKTVPVFDCIFGDSINDYTVPYHLTTKEFVGAIHELLSDDGLYLLNLIDMLDSGEFLGAVIATNQAVFPYVYVFNTGRPASIRDTFIVISSKRPLDLDNVPAEIRSQRDYRGGLLTPLAVDALVRRTGAVILTDDYAPVENLLANVVRTRAKDLGEVYLENARRLSAKGKLDEAIEQCRKALRVHEYWPVAHETLATLLLANGDTEGAIGEWKCVVDEDPRAKQAWFDLGRTLLKAGRMDEGIAALQTAADLDPIWGQPHVTLGVMYLQQGKMDFAVKELRKAVEIDPSLMVAQYNLGLALAQQGDLREATELWRKTLIIDPNYENARYNLVVALDKLGLFDDAWTEVNKWRERGGNVDAAVLEMLRRDSGRNE